MRYTTGYACYWCDGTAFPIGVTIWPGSYQCVCHTCGTVDKYNTDIESRRNYLLGLEIQAKKDSVKLREGEQPGETEVLQKLYTRITHLKAALLRRREEYWKYTLDDYDKAFQDVQDCNNPDRYLELNFRLCEIREALDTQE